MICPECGYEIPEGQLLCEKCGYEINIVPDFDIEIENSISESLSTIVEEIAPQKKDSDENVTIDNEEENSQPKSKELLLEEEFFKDHTAILKDKMSKKVIAFIVIGIFISIIVLFAFIFSIYSKNSVNYHINKAEKLIKKHEYDKALFYIEEGQNINSERVDLYYYKSNIYYQAGRFDEALDTILECIDSKKLDDATAIELYGLLINIYENQGKADDINAALINSVYDSVKNEYESFMAYAPTFSLETGYYDEPIMIEMTSNTDGSIYYTTDGTLPSANHGIKFTEPILLDKGEFDIRAVFVNSHGATSEISSNYFLVAVKVPEIPVIIPESGVYTRKFTINATPVNNTDKIYYTFDGSIPDEENGILYEGPVMPKAGKSNMSFVSISEDGISSEVVNRSYDFDVTANMNAAEAISHLIINLVNAGKLADVDGKSNDGNGVYSFNFESLVEIPNDGYYYILSEFYQEGYGDKQDTTRRYVVDPFTGNAYYLMIDDVGKYFKVPLG